MKNSYAALMNACLQGFSFHLNPGSTMLQTFSESLALCFSEKACDVLNLLMS